MTFEERLRLVDELVEVAAVSLQTFSEDDLKCANDLSDIFEIKFGVLIRRTEAIRMLGENKSNVELLREAAKQLIAMDDQCTMGE